MKDNHHITMMVFFILIVGTAGMTISGDITGYAVRSTPDYQTLVLKMESDARETLESSYFFEKNEYIVSLKNYEGGLEEVYDILPDYEVQELALVDAVAISARKSQMYKILEEKDVGEIYLDDEVSIARNSALGVFNLSSVRSSGPSAHNKTGDGIKIGIMDTGADHTHPEFNCIPGSAGCLFARSVSITSTQTGLVTRTRLEDRFDDFTKTKALDLSNGDTKVTIALYPNNTINSAFLDVNTTSFSVSLNGTNVLATKPLNLESAIEAANCPTTEDLCYYTLAFSGSSSILIENLSINYTFARNELNATGTDANGHGTLVTGIVHATAPDAQIYNYQILNANGDGTISDIIEAIELAIIDDVDVLSLSLGAPRFNQPCAYSILEDAIQEAYDRGIVVVAASGNDPTDDVYVPACFNNTVAVGSVNDNTNPSTFTSIGPEMEFAMPGENINSTNSTTIGGLYTSGSGTSFATPFATAMFAIVQEAFSDSFNKKLEPHQLRNFTQSYARDIFLNGKDDSTGYGLLHVSTLLGNLSTTPQIFTNVDAITHTESSTANSFELFTTSQSPLAINVSWTNITVNASTVPVKLNGQDSPISITATESVSFITTLDTASIDTSALGGTYESVITITAENITHTIPIKLTVEGQPIPFTYDLGIISAFDDMSAFIEYSSALLTSAEFFNASEAISVSNLNLTNETLNYLSFYNSSFGTYSPKTVFNLGDFFYPILKVDSGASTTFQNFFIVISSTEESDEVLEGVLGITSDGEDFYYFSTDGNTPFLTDLAANHFGTQSTSSLDEISVQDDIARVLAFTETIYDSNLFPLLNTSEYTVTLLASNATDNVTLKQTTITVLNNLSIVNREGFFFLDEPSALEFDVIDNRGFRINHIVNGTFTYNTTLYGVPTITSSINGTTLNTTVTSATVVTTLQNASFNEGLSTLNISFNVSNNLGTFSGPVTVLEPISISGTSLNTSLQNDHNVTYTLAFTNHGILPANITVNLSVSAGCQDSVDINETTFTLTNVDNASTRDILLFANDTYDFANQCTLSVASEVFGVCTHCADASAASYLETSTLNFNLANAPSPLIITSAIDDTNIRIGEVVTLHVNVTNNGTDNFVGTLATTFSGSSSDSVSIPNESVSLTVGETESYSYSAAFASTGTKNFTSTINNSLFSSSTTESVSVAGDYLSVSIARNASKIYENDSLNISVTITNHNDEAVTATAKVTSIDSARLTLDSSTSATQSESIAKLSKDIISYIVSADKGGATSLSGTASAENFSTTWNYSFTIQEGGFVNITLTDSFKRYTIDVNDTLGFIVDDQCVETYDDCDDLCEDVESECRDSCRDAYDAAREVYASCKEKCNTISDKDDRNDCRDDCRDDFNEADDDQEECRDECTEDETDCKEYCEDDLDDCQDGAVDAEMYIDELVDEEIFFDIEAENLESFSMEEGDSITLDLDDDGYLDTEMQLTELVENETNVCEDACEETQDADDEVCDTEFEECRELCEDEEDDEAECRDDCRDVKDECEDDVDFEFDLCMDDCETTYSDYEIKIKYLKENASTKVTTTTDTDTTNATINQTNATTTNTTNTTNTTTTPPVIPQTPSTPQEECGPSNIGLCADELSCINAYGYWYEDACHAERQQTPQAPPEPEPQPTTPTQDPVDQTPTLEQPASTDGGFNWITIAIVLLVLGGLAGGGYYFLKSTHDVSDLNSGSQSDQLVDYFMKQVAKGNNMSYIVQALKKLGWDPKLVDEAAGRVMQDPLKQQTVQILMFANQYNTHDPQVIRTRFGQYDQRAIEEALSQLMKHKSGKL